jgi:glycosyltransferase involved in cell wall biosynthesis
MALLEAMALGRPVIAGMNSGGVTWVLDEGRSGYLTDVRKPNKIVQTLLMCLRQTEDRKQRQRNAYDRVLSVFSPKTIAEQYEKIYEKVISTY